jgi:hypothetical protein
MDANGNIIPIVEGDQGEGFKDPYEGEDDPYLKSAKEQLNKLTRIEAEKTKPILKPEPIASPRVRIQKGMIIHFYGFAYKCTAARPNGKVTLKFKGLWKGEQR